MNDWLEELNADELAYWVDKPQSEKDWWESNTEPDDRADILRTEISGKQTYEEFLRLPEADRNAIIARLDKQADEALARLRQRGISGKSG